MTLKRGNDCDDGSDYKRLRYDNDAQTWPSCASVSELADLDLTEELAVQQVDSFLKRVGVCAGIHAASDAQCDAANRRQGMFAMHEEWQGLTEHTW